MATKFTASAEQTLMTPGEIIYKQVGHKAFFMMGAKNILVDERRLQWHVGSNCKKVSAIVVILDDNDTYTVEFHKGRGLNMKLAKSYEGVYVDSLHGLIQDNTGFYLSL